MATTVNPAQDRNADLATAIRQRNAAAIDAMMFEGAPPTPRAAFRTETELWDYKGDCPGLSKEHLAAWVEIAVHVLAFHNRGGGILVFGIRDSDYGFCGATTRLDSKLINDKLRRFLSDRIWVEFYRLHIQATQRYLGIAIVPSRGPAIERFRADSPIINGERRFSTGDSAIRENDSSRVLPKPEADRFMRELSVPTLGRVYAVDEPFFRVLNPDYTHFVRRDIPCREIETALRDPRAAVASLIGVGGVGKTALATWAALQALEQRQFGFIVSITAKDRELTSSGIQALDPALTSFEALLHSILDVLGLPDAKVKTTEEKEQAFHKGLAVLLSKYNVNDYAASVQVYALKKMK